MEKRPGHEADTHHRLVPRLSMHGFIPPLSNTSSWRGACLSTRTALHCRGDSDLREEIHRNCKGNLKSGHKKGEILQNLSRRNGIPVRVTFTVPSAMEMICSVKDMRGVCEVLPCSVKAGNFKTSNT